MSTVDAKLVKELRDKTNAAMMECKKALTEAKGNIEEAETILRKKLGLSASKKAGREAKEGLIASYIHMGGKVGVLLEVNCETDFVAKNDNFREFVKDVTLQIAAANPQFVTREEVPQELIDKEKEIAAAQITGKPENVVEKIVAGKIDKFLAGICLMEQPYIKDQNLTIDQMLKEKIGEIGENIIIRRFTRYAVGE
jgi:elongation factor Ts